MLSPAVTGFMICTRPAALDVYSTITTASAPGGAGRRSYGRGLAGLKRRKSSVRAPALISPITLSAAGSWEVRGPHRVAVAHGPGKRRKIAVGEDGLGQDLSGGGGFQQLYQLLAPRAQRRGMIFDQVTSFLETEDERRLRHGSHAEDDTTGDCHRPWSRRIVSAGNPVRLALSIARDSRTISYGYPSLGGEL